MRRVYAIWFLRTALRPVFVKFYIFLALGWWFITNVSLDNILANAFGRADLGRNLIFFADAFVQTELGVKFTIIAILAVLGWLAVGLVSNRRIMGTN